MPALTRGPLPPSVYWRRRLIVLTVVVVLLWTLLHLLGGGGGTPKATPAADLTGASTRSTSRTPAAGPPTASVTLGPAIPTTAASTAPMLNETPSPTPTVLPTPTGACPASDVVVTPSVAAATAGANVAIVLNLQTSATPACTWRVGHKTMQVKVTTAGGAAVWSTVDCPAAIPTADVVVYKDAPAPVTVTWSSRRSDAECSTHADWAKAGNYRVTGVALGGSPEDAAFTLAAPVAAPPAQPSTSPTPSGTTTTATTPTAPATPAGGATADAKKKHKKQPVAD